MENKENSSDNENSIDSVRDQEYSHRAILSSETTKKNKNSRNQKDIEFCLRYCNKRKDYTIDNIIVQNHCLKKKLIRLIKKYFRVTEYSIVIEQIRTGDWNLVFGENETIYL